jgi:hypothetical protein
LLAGGVFARQEPLYVSHYRMMIQDARTKGVPSRKETRQILMPTGSAFERRRGDLTPAEFGMLFEEEWPK